MALDMKWVYFYTEDYKFWHEHLTETLREDFEINAILVPPLSAGSKNGEHHFRGISVKIKILIDIIKKNAGQTIIFSDSTLWINRANVEKLRAYVGVMSNKYDIIFASNSVNYRDVNIGFMLLRCNSRTKLFFEKILSKFDVNSWDQELVNDNLPGVGYLKITRLRFIHALRYAHQKVSCYIRPDTLTWSFFDREKIVCGVDFPEYLRDSFYIYKQFISSSSPVSNWNQRIARLRELGFVTDGVANANFR